jgi:hypothetical protein
MLEKDLVFEQPLSEDEIKMGGGIVPQMSLPTTVDSQEDQISKIVSDEQLVGVYNEIIDNIRQDRRQVEEYINNFADLVINEGDSTSASKEALVNLVKIKSDMSDKMSKVADLMTRIKLKDKDTFPRYLAASQNNTININSGNTKRQLLEALNKKNEEKKDEI